MISHAVHNEIYLLKLDLNCMVDAVSPIIIYLSNTLRLYDTNPTYKTK